MTGAVFPSIKGGVSIATVIALRQPEKVKPKKRSLARPTLRRPPAEGRRPPAEDHEPFPWLVGLGIPTLLGLITLVLSVKPEEVPRNLQLWFSLLRSIPVIFDRRYIVVVIVLAIVALLYVGRRVLRRHWSIIPIGAFALSLASFFLFVGYFYYVGDSVAGPACKLAGDFRLVKSSPSSWSVMYGNQLAYNFNAAELNDLYGGKTPPGGCGRLFAGDDYFGLVLGHQNDLLIAFGVVRQFGLATGLNKMSFFPHDYGMAIATSKDDFVANYGREHDLSARFCWNFKRDDTWWHNANARAGVGPCVANNWPFAIDNSASGQVQKSEIAFLGRGIGSLLGLDRLAGAKKPW